MSRASFVVAECAGGACGRLRSLSLPSRVERRVPRAYLVQYLCVFRKNPLLTLPRDQRPSRRGTDQL
eukprot:4275577-Prymnesium_polylepis.2